MIILARLLLSVFCATLVLAAHSSSAAQAPAAQMKLVMLIAEHEYETARTLPAFAAAQLARDFRMVTLTGSTAPGENSFERIEEIADADVLLVSVRRRTLPKAQLEFIRRHVAAGKPVVGIRTASHAFALGRGQTLADGNAAWPEFDHDVIGGNYSNHHGAGPLSTVTSTAPAGHPILRGVALPFTSPSSLYKNTPLRDGAQLLLSASIPGKPAEPVAWTFTRRDGGRTFYTSLGSPADFENPAFVQLLRNGILWVAR